METEDLTRAQQQAELCGILGNARRILIIWALQDAELSVSDLSRQINTSLQNTSQHLRLMKDKGILEARRDGREIYYRIAETVFSKQCPVISRKL